jgi:hypothetical protein
MDSSDFCSPESWPTTLEEAIRQIIAQMPENDRDALRKMSRSSLLGLHFGLGMYIRNRYGLLQGNEELLRAACGRDRLCDPDQASMRIVEAVWDALQ